MNDCSCQGPTESAEATAQRPAKSLGVAHVFDAVVLNANATLQSLPFQLDPRTNALQLTALVMSTSGSVSVSGFILGANRPEGPWISMGTFNLGAVGFSAANAVTGVSFRWFVVALVEGSASVDVLSCDMEAWEG